MLRAQHLSSLQNKVITKIDDRITKKADNFTNSELLNALNIIQTTQEKNTNYVNSVNEKPQVQIVSNNLNVSVDEISKESRDRITSAVEQILAIVQNSNNDEQENLIIETTATEEE